ncbi:YslB family protein [Sporosarcina sp. 179-K 3D1 HS]|uniref:YslB family protein n=1 Tax=Sporosarcina sp. 179-K 3D1 HS TaxID=3232169 RepID=UPI00399F7334
MGLEETTYDSPTRFGYDLLRNHVLPSILGKHEDDILYWAGKEVARKFPVFGIDELPVFFTEAGWGSLILEKTSKDEALYIMAPTTGPNASHRSYTLEAGFIAEQYQKLNGVLTECYGEVNEKEEQIHFTVKWDPKTKIDM